MARPKVEGPVTSRDLGKKKGLESKYFGPKDRKVESRQIDVPERMDVIFKDNALDRWVVLTPQAWNKHNGYFIAVPATVERTHLDPFEYPFSFDRQNHIALCSQVRPIAIDPPYFSFGKLSRVDHEQITRLLIKLIGEPSVAAKL